MAYSIIGAPILEPDWIKCVTGCKRRSGGCILVTLLLSICTVQKYGRLHTSKICTLFILKTLFNALLQFPIKYLICRNVEIFHPAYCFSYITHEFIGSIERQELLGIYRDCNVNDNAGDDDDKGRREEIIFYADFNILGHITTFLLSFL